MVKAFAAREAKGKLDSFEYDPGPLGSEYVEVKVASCGLCHSDLSMLNNDWGMTSYPFVPGHEIVGRISRVGARVRHLREGQMVGVGWFAGSCMTCAECMGGDHNLCGMSEHTIVGRHGGFAEFVRAKAEWAIPLPDDLDAAKAGPLFCGGITVFNPFVILGIRPTDRIGVVGIGGLGHLALQFGRAWGCEVTAFSTTAGKEEEARGLGAHHFVATRNAETLAAHAGQLDMILVTVNVPQDWEPYLAALRAKGRLHFVGAVPEVKTSVFSMLGGQKSISASPLGSPLTVRRMLEFCARHGIEARTEHLPMSRVNEAITRLRDGRPRYRMVLDADF
ncbi:MAG: NAD(P)-dependent alcohol dehydrogenase [Opitutales bacterium]|nr:NAD(P)-dependent alcohol dehydrogenase [Opitutales bacterium]